MPKGSSGRSTPAQRIAAAEERISRNNFETGILFDTNGNVILEKRGTTNEVSFTGNELAQMKGKILTHNHPFYKEVEKLGIKQDSAFSPDDLGIAFEKGISELRMTIGDSKYSFEWITKHSIDANILLDDIDKMYKTINRSIRKINKNYNSGKYNTYEEYQKVYHNEKTKGANKINNYLSNEVNQSQIGYKFRKE